MFKYLRNLFPRAAPNLPYLRAPDGDTSKEPREFLIFVSYCQTVPSQRARFLHLDFRTGFDDDDLAVRRPIFLLVIFHVVESHCLVVLGDGDILRTVAVLLISAIVKL